jgi:prepilin-type N-terminal cleavage/methylation domain-containing protein
MTAPRRRGHDDDGFTLVETLVALGLIGVVMAALVLFFIQSTAANRKQADTQGAAQAAMTAMERVSLLTGRSVLQGRTDGAVAAQWAAPAPGVGVYLDPAKTERAADESDPPGEVQLPTTPEPVLVGGQPSRYRQSFYVGRCWQPPRAGECVVVPEAQRAGRIPMYRVVVAVTWNSKACAQNRCSYVTAVLLGANVDDPTFGL